MHLLVSFLLLYNDEPSGKKKQKQQLTTTTTTATITIIIIIATKTKQKNNNKQHNLFVCVTRLLEYPYSTSLNTSDRYLLTLNRISGEVVTAMCHAIWRGLFSWNHKPNEIVTLNSQSNLLIHRKITCGHSKRTL